MASQTVRDTPGPLLAAARVPDGVCKAITATTESRVGGPNRNQSLAGVGAGMRPNLKVGALRIVAMLRATSTNSISGRHGLPE